jgi:hypothetical protein
MTLRPRLLIVFFYVTTSGTALAAEGNLWFKEWIVGAEVGAGISSLLSDRAPQAFSRPGLVVKSV